MTPRVWTNLNFLLIAALLAAVTVTPWPVARLVLGGILVVASMAMEPHNTRWRTEKRAAAAAAREAGDRWAVAAVLRSAGGFATQHDSSLAYAIDCAAGAISPSNEIRAAALRAAARQALAQRCGPRVFIDDAARPTPARAHLLRVTAEAVEAEARS